MSTVILLYPSGHNFDMDYYLSKHVKLIEEHWSPIGLKSWEVVQLSKKDAPYQVQCTLKWESEDAYKAAVTGPSAKFVLGDVPNYTTARPISLSGTEKATSAKI